jgi:hypothetical protein
MASWHVTSQKPLRAIFLRSLGERVSFSSQKLHIIVDVINDDVINENSQFSPFLGCLQRVMRLQRQVPAAAQAPRHLTRPLTNDLFASPDGPHINTAAYLAAKYQQIASAPVESSDCRLGGGLCAASWRKLRRLA